MTFHGPFLDHVQVPFYSMDKTMCLIIPLDAVISDMNKVLLSINVTYNIRLGTLYDDILRSFHTARHYSISPFNDL